MGRFGGHEIGYGSDADVMFVHDPLPGADEQEAAAGPRTRSPRSCARCSAAPAPDPPLLIDADLRPEGRQGPLVRTLASYRAYYERWSLRLGGPGTAAGRAGGRATAELGAAVHRRWPTSSAIPPGGIRRRSRAGDPAASRPGWRPNGCRAAPTRRCTSSSAPAGCPTSSGWCSCCSCGTRTRCPGCGRRGRWRRLTAAGGGGPGGRRATRPCSRAAWRLATRIRNAVMLVRGPAIGHAARPPARARRGGSVLGYPPGGHQDLVRGLPADGPPGPGGDGAPVLRLNRF